MVSPFSCKRSYVIKIYECAMKRLTNLSINFNVHIVTRQKNSTVNYIRLLKAKCSTSNRTHIPVIQDKLGILAYRDCLGIPADLLLTEILRRFNTTYRQTHSTPYMPGKCFVIMQYVSNTAATDINWYKYNSLYK